jgi:hypothetical protein
MSNLRRLKHVTSDDELTLIPSPSKKHRTHQQSWSTKPGGSAVAQLPPHTLESPSPEQDSQQGHKADNEYTEGEATESSEVSVQAESPHPMEQGTVKPVPGPSQLQIIGPKKTKHTAMQPSQDSAVTSPIQPIIRIYNFAKYINTPYAMRYNSGTADTAWSKVKDSLTIQVAKEQQKLPHALWSPGKGDGDPNNPATWQRYDPPIVPALTSKFVHDADGVNGVPANVFPSALVIAAILNAPVAAATRQTLFPGTFGKDGMPFTDIVQFGRPAVTSGGTVIAVLTGRNKENRLVLYGEQEYQTRNMPIEIFTPRNAETGRRYDIRLPVIKDFLARTWREELSFSSNDFGSLKHKYSNKLRRTTHQGATGSATPSINNTPPSAKVAPVTPVKKGKGKEIDRGGALLEDSSGPGSVSKHYTPVAERIVNFDPFAPVQPNEVPSVSGATALILQLYSCYSEAQSQVINIANTQSLLATYIASLRGHLKNGDMPSRSQLLEMCERCDKELKNEEEEFVADKAAEWYWKISYYPLIYFTTPYNRWIRFSLTFIMIINKEIHKKVNKQLYNL